jgi:hypothetical protein
MLVGTREDLRLHYSEALEAISDCHSECNEESLFKCSDLDHVVSLCC